MLQSWLKFDVSKVKEFLSSSRTWGVLANKFNILSVDDVQMNTKHLVD